MLKTFSENRRLFALLLLGGFSVFALAGLDTSSTVVSSFAIAVVGNVIADLITIAISNE